MVEYNWFSPKTDWVITCYIQNNRPFLADLVLYESVVETNLKFSLKNEKESLLKQLPVKIQLSAFIINLKKTLWSLFMDGVQLPQGYRVTTRRQFSFYH